MTGGTLNMKGDAAPDTGGGTVDVAEKHKIRHARALKDLPFRFGVLELEGVHVRQAEIERRMMLEQKDRLVGGASAARARGKRDACSHSRPAWTSWLSPSVSSVMMVA